MPSGWLVHDYRQRLARFDRFQLIVLKKRDNSRPPSKVKRRKAPYPSAVLPWLTRSHRDRFETELFGGRQWDLSRMARTPLARVAHGSLRPSHSWELAPKQSRLPNLTKISVCPRLRRQLALRQSSDFHSRWHCHYLRARKHNADPLNGNRPRLRISKRRWR